jgi:[protein-PII] uridylyltransferase
VNTLVANVLRQLAVDDVDGDAVSANHSAAVQQRVLDLVGPLPDGWAVLALGGLARRQLLPGTDVDLLFLHRDPNDAIGAVVDLGAIVARLWDAGLKASWSVRAAADLVSLFELVDGKDGHAAMALLEARPIGGDLAFAKAALTQLRRGLGSTRRQRLLQARLNEAFRRRARFFHSPSLVEPDVKDGPGGLRDVHLLGWVGLCTSGVDVDVAGGDTLRALLTAGVLLPSEFDAVVQARRELLTVRAALLCTSPGEQRLHAGAGETAAQAVSSSSLDAGMRPGEALVRRATRAMRQCLVVVDDALVRLLPREVAWPLRVRQPRTALGLGDLLSSTETTSFPGPLTGLLERGLLASILPDIERLQGRVKHDGVHAFCTDAHLARCGDLALAIVGGAPTSALGDVALPAPLRPVLMRLERSAVVVAGALFHDIGKGLPGDHSEVGEAIARRELPRLGLSDDDIDDVCFIIRHHLLLSNTVQRSDLGDPRVIDALTETITTTARLDALALVTWCDWCAVGPGVGTAWKGRLLADGVEVVRQALLQPELRARDEQAIRSHARQVLTRAGVEGADAFVDGASAAWLRSRSSALLVDDARAYATLLTRGAGAVVAAPVPGVPQRAWVLAPDRRGLLADLAAAFASEGVNVLDAALDVRADATAFDGFVIDDGRAGVLHIDTSEILEGALRDAIRQRVRKPAARKAVHVVTPRVRVVDATAERVVVEVRGADRRGLLHDLARVFAEHELSITLARLHTEGARVTDVFTAVATGAGIIDDEKKQRLTSALLACVGT